MAGACHAMEQRYHARLDDVRRHMRQLRNVRDSQLHEVPIDLVNHAAASLLLECIVMHLDGAEIVGAISTCSAWAQILTSDNVWADQCTALWADKLHVPEHFRDARRIESYWASLADGEREEITADELCSFPWTTRMKGCAGENWTSTDPWWNNAPAPPRRYQPDGYFVDPAKGGGTWRFPRASSSTGCSATVRHSREHCEYPRFFTSRFRWGWVMQNPWSICTSFPLPPKGECPDLEDGGVVCERVTVQKSKEEVLRFNAGLPVVDDDDDDVDAVNSGSCEDDGDDPPRHLLPGSQDVWKLFDRFDRVGFALTRGMANLLAGQQEQEQEVPGGPGSSSGHAEATAVLTEEELTTQHALAEIGLERGEERRW